MRTPLSGAGLSTWLAEACRDDLVHVHALADDAGRTFGNNGDRLMLAGMDRVISAAQLRQTNVASEADVLIIPPSGALRDGYSKMQRCLAQVAKSFRGHHVIILPSSVHLEHSRLSEWLPFQARITIFCRERYSEQHVLASHLEGHWADLDVRLAHDMAFSWGRTPVRSQMGGRRYALQAWRHDAEALRVHVAFLPAAGARRTVGGRARPFLSRSAPDFSKRWIDRRMVSRVGRQRLGGMPVWESWSGRVLSGDVSNSKLYSFDEYLEAISGASIVFTDRLHVAVPAALLGIETHLFDVNYHKVRGVFELSLSDIENVIMHRIF
jgi:exopolysaccharide biosynthesis predicted pyruvyltransferase EpsI